MRTIDHDVALWSAPAGERAGRPLVVLLHGRGGREGDMEPLASLLAPSHVAVSLRAGRAHGDGFSWLGKIESETDLAVGLDDAAADLLGWIAANQEDSPHVGIIGWSQGGAVALQALRLSPAAAGFVVILAGFTGGSFRADDAELARLRPPVFWGRGDRDDVIPRHDIARLASFLQSHTALTEVEYPGVGHEIPPAAMQDVRRFVTAHDARNR